MRGSTLVTSLYLQHEIEEDIKRNIHPSHLLNWPFTIGGLHKCSNEKLEEMIRELQSILDYRREQSNG